MNTAPGELRALTGARGIAAWAVVLYHLRLSIAGLSPVAEKLMAKGYLAVDFFFLLSGFVIWLRWHDRLRDPGAHSRFFVKRIARVWPLHLVMLAAAAGLAGLLVITGHRPASADPWRELPLHLFLLQNWGLTDPLTFNDPAWSISAESNAYLLFPLLVAAVDWRRWSRPALVVAAVMPVAILAFVMRDQTGIGADIAHHGLIRCLCEFTTGTTVAALWLRGGGTATPLIVAAAAVAAGMAGLPEPAAAPLLLAALLLALARSAGRPCHPLETRAIHYLGQVSYATYLVHMVAWRVFKLVFVTDASAVSPRLIALYCAIVLGLSVILYEYLECPAQRRIGAFFHRPGKRADGDPLLQACRQAPSPAPRRSQPPAPGDGHGISPVDR